MKDASIRALARRHRVHRRTARQALRSALPPPREPAARAAPQLGPHRATIRAWLVADLSAPRKQRHTARRIWERLVDERGAIVAEPTVRAYVARVRRELESGRAQVSIPQVHPPGEVRRPTSGRASVWLDGELTELPISLMRLSHLGGRCTSVSRARARRPSSKGHTIAFRRLGGVRRRIRDDNLSSAVVRVLRGRDRVENPRTAPDESVVRAETVTPLGEAVGLVEHPRADLALIERPAHGGEPG